MIYYLILRLPYNLSMLNIIFLIVFLIKKKRQRCSSFTLYSMCNKQQLDTYDLDHLIWCIRKKSFFLALSYSNLSPFAIYWN